MHMLGIPSVMRARNTFDGPAPLDDGRVNGAWQFTEHLMAYPHIFCNTSLCCYFGLGKAEVRTDVSGQR